MPACIPPSPPPPPLLLTNSISLFRHSALSLSHCSFGAPQPKNIECVLSFVMWSILVGFSERGPGRAFFQFSLSLSLARYLVSSLFNSVNCYSLKRTQVRIRLQISHVTGQFIQIASTVQSICAITIYTNV